LRREGCNSVNHRTVVSSTRKLALLAQSKLQAHWVAAEKKTAPPLAAICYLIEGCDSSEPVLPSTVKLASQRSMSEKIEWLLSLSERLEFERRGLTPPAQH
jgi:phytoene synthase